MVTFVKVSVLIGSSCCSRQCHRFENVSTNLKALSLAAHHNHVYLCLCPRAAATLQVDALVGFWFDIDPREGVQAKFKSCANYFNNMGGRMQSRAASAGQQEQLIGVLRSIRNLPF
jgi:hypothetical protein